MGLRAVSQPDAGNITGNLTVTGNLSVTGNSTITGNEAVTGTLGVTGNTSLGNLSIAGVVSSNLSVQQNETITGNLSVTGKITPGQTTGIIGTTSNNSVAAGGVGEVISSAVEVGSPVDLTVSGTSYNVTTIALTAGDWDVSLDGYFTGNAATTFAFGKTSISSTSATHSTAAGACGWLVMQSPAITTFGGILSSVSLHCGPIRVSLAGTTTYYAVFSAGFAVNSCAGYCLFRARRIR